MFKRIAITEMGYVERLADRILTHWSYERRALGMQLGRQPRRWNWVVIPNPM